MLDFLFSPGGWGFLALAIAVLVYLGYNVLYFEVKLPNSSTPGQILDILDYVSNYILMPVIALATCILVGWVLKPRTVVDEITKNGEKFSRRKMYNIMVRYICPAFIIIILLTSVGLF